MQKENTSKLSYTKYLIFIPLCLLYSVNTANSENIEVKNTIDCTYKQKLCLLNEIEKTSLKITNSTEKDKTHRELAKLYASQNHFEKAYEQIKQINNHDTKAMTIRGIGMAVAELDLNEQDRSQIYKKLLNEANKIDHPPSFAIALTYIAMAQAFAGDDQAAWETASKLENASLRRKAFGETAEIQAEKGKYEEVLSSLEKINDKAYKNKSLTTVSRIFANKKHYEQAYNIAMLISNPYKKAIALQYLIETQPDQSKKIE